MGPNFGAWKTATLDYDRTDLEFTGDDVDQFSDLVDLGGDYEFITVHFDGVIDSGTLNPWVQKGAEISEVPVIKHILDADATGSFAHATTAAVTQVSVTFQIGGYQYLRLRTGGNQTADRTFSVRGFNR